MGSRPGKTELRIDELTPAGRTAGFRLSEVALQVEHAGKDGEQQRLDETLPLLEQRYTELKQAMQEFLR